MRTDRRGRSADSNLAAGRARPGNQETRFASRGPPGSKSGRPPPQLRGGQTENAAERPGEVAVAGKAEIDADLREVRIAPEQALHGGVKAGARAVPVQGRARRMPKSPHQGIGRAPEVRREALSPIGSPRRLERAPSRPPPSPLESKTVSGAEGSRAPRPRAPRRRA